MSSLFGSLEYAGDCRNNLAGKLSEVDYLAERIVVAALEHAI